MLPQTNRWGTNNVSAFGRNNCWVLLAESKHFMCNFILKEKIFSFLMKIKLSSHGIVRTVLFMIKSHCGTINSRISCRRGYRDFVVSMVYEQLFFWWRDAKKSKYSILITGKSCQFWETAIGRTQRLNSCSGKIMFLHGWYKYKFNFRVVGILATEKK